MRNYVLAAVAASALLAGCATYDYDGGYARYSAYDYDKPDPAYGAYWADRYYRTGPRWHEYRLSETDRVYRGHDGRYYCRRSDGTTGLILGGHRRGCSATDRATAIRERSAPCLARRRRRDRRAIDRGNVRCR